MSDYRSPTDVEIQRLSLVTAAGQVHELEAVTQEVNIYQSLFAHYMKCDLVVGDATGLLNSFAGFKNDGVTGGFVGGELLLISYKTNGNDADVPVRNHVFALYECANRTRTSEDKEVYLLRGISLEAISTVNKTISKAYGGVKGNLISSMINSIVNEYIMTRQTKSIYETLNSSLNFNIRKTYSADRTTGLHKILIPDYSVDDAIDMLCKEADDDKHIPYYIFFENSAGFKFRDLANLVQQESIETYSYKPSNMKEGKDTANEDFFDRTKIISLTVERQTNSLHNAQRGLFSSSMTTIDLLQKTKTETTFKYEKHHDKFTKLQSQSFKINGYQTFDTAGTGYLMTTRKGHDSSTFFRAEAPIVKRIDDFYLAKHAYQAHIFNTVVEFMIPGDSNLSVGETVYLEIPVATSVEDQKNQEDKYVSGKYLITELRQKLPGKTGDRHFTSVRCVKDTGIKI